MTPGSGTETDAQSDASITAQAARAKELRLALAVIGFQRSLTRWRWLLDPLHLELTSQVETDQPLLSCVTSLEGATHIAASIFLQVSGESTPRAAPCPARR